MNTDLPAPEPVPSSFVAPLHGEAEHISEVCGRARKVVDGEHVGVWAHCGAIPDIVYPDTAFQGQALHDRTRARTCGRIKTAGTSRALLREGGSREGGARYHSVAGHGARTAHNQRRPDGDLGALGGRGDVILPGNQAPKFPPERHSIDRAGMYRFRRSSPDRLKRSSSTGTRPRPAPPARRALGRRQIYEAGATTRSLAVPFVGPHRHDVSRARERESRHWGRVGRALRMAASSAA